MLCYLVWCPARPELPKELLNASTSYNARKDYAQRHGLNTFDCVARRVLPEEQS